MIGILSTLLRKATDHPCGMLGCHSLVLEWPSGTCPVILSWNHETLLHICFTPNILSMFHHCWLYLIITLLVNCADRKLCFYFSVHNEAQGNCGCEGRHVQGVDARCCKHLVVVTVAQSMLLFLSSPNSSSQRSLDFVHEYNRLFHWFSWWGEEKHQDGWMNVSIGVVN